MLGYEIVLIQRLLAQSLNMPLPVTGANETNYGITVTLSGQSYQIFEKNHGGKELINKLCDCPSISSQIFMMMNQHTDS